MGEWLVKAWRTKEDIPEYKEVTQEFRERMRSLMLWRKEEWPYEYEYWKTHRGLKE